MTHANDEARTLIADAATSKWLRTAIEQALTRDPVDAVNDAETLVNLLARRLTLIFEESRK